MTLESMMSDADELAFREMFSVILAALAGMAILFLVVALFIASVKEEPYVPPGMTLSEVISDRIGPIGEVNMGGPELAVAATPADEAAAAAPTFEGPAAIYQAVCSTCHATGLAGAPELGATDQWRPRLESRGLETMYKHAINGFNAMPPRGGMMSLSDEQVRHAVDYMLKESGLSP